MAHIIVSNGTVIPDVERILHIFGVVGSLRHNRRCIRNRIDHFRPCVCAAQLEIVGVSLVQLYRQSVVDRVGRAFECDDAIKVGEGPYAWKSLVGQGPALTGHGDRGINGSANIDIVRALQMDATYPEVGQRECDVVPETVLDGEMTLLSVGRYVVLIEKEDR